jgi:ketosteroid isomerase-like protein
MTQRVRERDGEIVLATAAMYAAYGDRAGFDAHLHPDVTIWETDQPSGLIGLPELDALRDRRGTPAPERRPVLEVRDPLVDRWGDQVAVIRYLLHATGIDGEMAFRVTDVLARDGAGWRIVHHHAERCAATGGSAGPDAV